MLSIEGRNLLGIPNEAKLPDRMMEVYDQWLAGRFYETRFGEGWSFGKRGKHMTGQYDACLTHRTAQFNFALDLSLAVYVRCDNWVKIASSVIALIELDALMVASNAKGKRRRGLGTFQSVEAFKSQFSNTLAAFKDVSFFDSTLTLLYQGPKSMIRVGRSYEDQFLLSAVEFF